MVSTSRKKSPNKRMLFQLDRKSVSTSRNEEFFKKYVSTTQKIAYIGKDIQKIEENCCQWQ